MFMYMQGWIKVLKRGFYREVKKGIPDYNF